MPVPLWGLMAIGAGLGLLKNEAVDKPKEKRQREMQSITTRYSPWTKLQGQAPQESDALGSAMQGGMTAASFGQNLQANQQKLDYGEKYPHSAYSGYHRFGYPYYESRLANDAGVELQQPRDPRYPFLGAGG